MHCDDLFLVIRVRVGKGRRTKKGDCIIIIVNY